MARRRGAHPRGAHAGHADHAAPGRLAGAGLALGDTIILHWTPLTGIDGRSLGICTVIFVPLLSFCVEMKEPPWARPGGGWHCDTPYNLQFYTEWRAAHGDPPFPPPARLAMRGEVIFMPPCLFCMENH